MMRSELLFLNFMTGERRKMYLFLLALIYIAFISLGLPDSLLGSGWPVMHAELGVPVSYMGIISMIISGGTVVSSLFSDKMTRKFGTRIVTVASVFLTVIALFGFSFSSQFWMLAVFAVPYGLGAGAIDSALNNYVALHYKAKHMSWLHCFWGVGTIVSPFIMGYALKECRTGRCAENQGRSLPVAWIFCVLCTGGNSNAVGEHLLCRGKRNFYRACGNLCSSVLHRYYFRKICKRFYYG